jgi:hypothetical protein
MDIRRIRVTDGSRLVVTLPGDGARHPARPRRGGEATNRPAGVGTAVLSLPSGGPGDDAESVRRPEPYPGDTAGTAIHLAIEGGG